MFALILTLFAFSRTLAAEDFRGPWGFVTPRVVIGYSATDLIFPFSENWPANYNFSLFSKLPTNYPKNQKNIQNTIENTWGKNKIVI